MPSADPTTEIPTLERDQPLAAELLERVRQCGFLRVRNLVDPDELAVLQSETDAVIATMNAERLDQRPGVEAEDWFYDKRGVPFRIHWMIDKMPSYRAFLGNPRLLRVADELLGPGATPHTTHTMVFKNAGVGSEVVWHRDWQAPVTGMGWDWDRNLYLIAASLALDPYSEETGMWLVPGSHRWSRERVAEKARELRNPFRTDGAVVVPLEPGDLLLHNHLVLHGSKATAGPRRRGLQATFWSRELFDHVDGLAAERGIDVQRAWKRRVLASCVWARRFTSYGLRETPYYPTALGIDDCPIPTTRSCRSQVWHYADFERHD